MNKPHKHVELIKQWADGAEIQLSASHGWIADPRPSWSVSATYRIKPQPLECWRILYVDGTMSAISHPTKAAANSSYTRNSGTFDRIVHMREVVE